MGRPIGGSASPIPGGHRYSVEVTVTSVGP